MSAPDWAPTASLSRLRLRASLLASLRGFFAARGVLEVETPALVNAPVTDVNLDSAQATVGDAALFLHTSPEYAMKRLLAAGSGDIYQTCHVVRGGERGRLHNPEFTMLEWYRTGFSMAQLIGETADLLNQLMQAAGQPARPLLTRRYREAFLEHVGLDPFEAGIDTLVELAVQAGLARGTAGELSRDALLDLLVGTRLGPALGQGHWFALTHYPASQAALARLDPADPRLALRFEIYADGIELANGFEELASSQEQASRFAADNAERARRGLPVRAADARLLAALERGLPACSGVALGFDRTVMVAAGAHRIDEVIAFPQERA